MGRRGSRWTSPSPARAKLKIAYDVGQEFVTEPDYAPGRNYYASILSGSVPAAVEDGAALDLACIGKQVAEDVLVSFYPKLSRRETLKETSTTLGGLRARVVKLRLYFSEPNLRAKSELVSIAVLDLGRAEVAILYVSIPDTHKQYESITDEALTSIRPA